MGPAHYNIVPAPHSPLTTLYYHTHTMKDTLNPKPINILQSLRLAGTELKRLYLRYIMVELSDTQDIPYHKGILSFMLFITQQLVPVTVCTIPLYLLGLLFTPIRPLWYLFMGLASIGGFGIAAYGMVLIVLSCLIILGHMIIIPTILYQYIRSLLRR